MRWAVVGVLALMGCARAPLVSLPDVGSEEDGGTFEQVSTAVEITVEHVPERTCRDVLELRGSRSEGVAVLVGGVERVPAGPAGAWRAEVRLAAGANALEVIGTRGDERSEPIAIAVFFAPSGPPPPEVDPFPAVVSERELEISGVKPSDTALVVNGAVQLPEDEETCFSTAVPLADGANTITVDTADACGRPSGAAVTRTVTLEGDAPLAIDAPLPDAVVSGDVAVRGHLLVPGLALATLDVDGTSVARLPISPSGTFEGVWPDRGVAPGDGRHVVTVRAPGVQGGPANVRVTRQRTPRLVEGPARAPAAAAIAVLAGPHRDLAFAWAERDGGRVMMRVYGGGARPCRAVEIAPYGDTPALAAGDDGSVTVAWAGDEGIGLRTRGPAGDLDPPRALGAPGARSPSIAVRGARAAAVWEEDGVVMCSGDGGLTVTPLSDPGAADPRVAIDDDGATHVVWRAGGQLWQRQGAQGTGGADPCDLAPITIAGEVALEEPPSIAAQPGGGVVITWAGRRGALAALLLPNRVPITTFIPDGVRAVARASAEGRVEIAHGSPKGGRIATWDPTTAALTFTPLDTDATELTLALRGPERHVAWSTDVGLVHTTR